jgi:HK97 gp10 family phage protein
MANDVIGVAEVQLKLDKASKDIILKALDKIWIAGNKIADDARQTVPVNTGRLRDSIVAETPFITGDEIRCVISANTDYAIYVEMGTWKMKARPYLKPALYKNKDEFEREMKGLVD